MAPLTLKFLSITTLITRILANTCETISTTGIETSFNYTTEQTQYWSTACSALRPSCILSPKSASEVSTIIRALALTNESFAIKSGGHNPNLYFSSIDDGPLISTKNLNEVTLEREAQTVRVGPGNRWEDVSEALDGTGWTAVGGRVGNVGVGGYLPLGGLSFLSPQYGWATNSVLEFEIVLANGTIATASETCNRELWMALRGGGNRFGVITSYLLQAYPQSLEIYGGQLVFPANKQDAILDAIAEFTSSYDDPKAAVVPSKTQLLSGAIDTWIVYLFYDGPDPGTVFDKFLAAGPLVNDAKVRTFHDYMLSTKSAVMFGSVYTIGTETSPWPGVEQGKQVLESYSKTFQDTVDELAGVTGLLTVLTFQPVPKSHLAAAKAKGGDLLDMNEDSTFVVIEYNIAYSLLGVDDSKVDKGVVDFARNVKAQIDGFVSDGTLPKTEHLPLFANDAYHKQDYWGRIKAEKADLARKVRKEVDPDQFFSAQQGGWIL